jgi:hypothetical protein
MRTGAIINPTFSKWRIMAVEEVGTGHNRALSKTSTTPYLDRAEFRLFISVSGILIEIFSIGYDSLIST